MGLIDEEPIFVVFDCEGFGIEFELDLILTFEILGYSTRVPSRAAASASPESAHRKDIFFLVEDSYLGPTESACVIFGGYSKY